MEAGKLDKAAKAFVAAAVAYCDAAAGQGNALAAAGRDQAANSARSVLGYRIESAVAYYMRRPVPNASSSGCRRSASPTRCPCSRPRRPAARSPAGGFVMGAHPDLDQAIYDRLSGSGEFLPRDDDNLRKDADMATENSNETENSTLKEAAEEAVEALEPFERQVPDDLWAACGSSPPARRGSPTTRAVPSVSRRRWASSASSRVSRRATPSPGGPQGTQGGRSRPAADPDVAAGRPCPRPGPGESVDGSTVRSPTDKLGDPSPPRTGPPRGGATPRDAREGPAGPPASRNLHRASAAPGDPPAAVSGTDRRVAGGRNPSGPSPPPPSPRPTAPDESEPPMTTALRPSRPSASR